MVGSALLDGAVGDGVFELVVGGLFGWLGGLVGGGHFGLV